MKNALLHTAIINELQLQHFKRKELCVECEIGIDVVAAAASLFFYLDRFGSIYFGYLIFRGVVNCLIAITIKRYLSQNNMRATRAR